VFSKCHNEGGPYLLEWLSGRLLVLLSSNLEEALYKDQ